MYKFMPSLDAVLRDPKDGAFTLLLSPNLHFPVHSLAVLGIEPKASCMLGKHSTTELQPQSITKPC